MRIFNFLASLCSWAGWFESGFVGNPEDRLSRNEAHIVMSDFFFSRALDCFTDLVYRYYKDGRRPISPWQNRPGNPYRWMLYVNQASIYHL